jgi:hypothetical protein
MRLPDWLARIASHAEVFGDGLAICHLSLRTWTPNGDGARWDGRAGATSSRRAHARPGNPDGEQNERRAVACRCAMRPRPTNKPVRDARHRERNQTGTGLYGLALVCERPTVRRTGIGYRLVRNTCAENPAASEHLEPPVASSIHLPGRSDPPNTYLGSASVASLRGQFSPMTEVDRG